MENTVHPLQTLIEDAGYDTRSYSGRGMYGKTCFAVSTHDIVGRFISCIMQVYGCICSDSNDDSVAMDARDEVERAMSHLQSDSMGLGRVYYWPGVPYTDPDNHPMTGSL